MSADLFLLFKRLIEIIPSAVRKASMTSGWKTFLMGLHKNMHIYVGRGNLYHVFYCGFPVLVSSCVLVLRFLVYLNTTMGSYLLISLWWRHFWSSSFKYFVARGQVLPHTLLRHRQWGSEDQMWDSIANSAIIIMQLKCNVEFLSCRPTGHMINVSFMLFMNAMVSLISFGNH